MRIDKIGAIVFNGDMSKSNKRCACGRYLRNTQLTQCARCRRKALTAMKTQLKKQLGFKRGGGIGNLFINQIVDGLTDQMTPPRQTATEVAAATVAARFSPPFKKAGIYKVPRSGDIPAGEIGVA